MHKQQTRTARVAAMDLLARREHSQQELQQKLRARGFADDEADAAITRLCEQGLQSDARFAEAYTTMRAKRGFGSVRIKQELQQRGVDAQTLVDAMAAANIDWWSAAQTAYSKKFGSDKATDRETRAKQQRFLQYRGFALDIIQDILD